MLLFAELSDVAEEIRKRARALEVQKVIDDDRLKKEKEDLARGLCRVTHVLQAAEKDDCGLTLQDVGTTAKAIIVQIRKVCVCMPLLQSMLLHIHSICEV
jgi:hypothetical protein